MTIPKTNSAGISAAVTKDVAAVDPGRRAFLRGTVALAGLALTSKLLGCAEESGNGGCSDLSQPASCSYRAADSARCAVWNNQAIEIDGISFFIKNIRREGTAMKADIEARVPGLGCGSPFPEPTTIPIPSTGAFTVQGRGYYVTIHNAVIAEDSRFSWADVEVKRFFTYCEMGTVTQVLSMEGGVSSAMSSSDGNLTIMLVGVEPYTGRAILRILDSEGVPRELLTMREGDVRYGQVGDKIYPITAHIVVAGTADLAACAEISISTCSELPHSGGVDFSW